MCVCVCVCVCVNFSVLNPSPCVFISLPYMSNIIWTCVFKRIQCYWDLNKLESYSQEILDMVKEKLSLLESVPSRKSFRSMVISDVNSYKLFSVSIQQVTLSCDYSPRTDRIFESWTILQSTLVIYQLTFWFFSSKIYLISRSSFPQTFPSDLCETRLCYPQHLVENKYGSHFLHGLGNIVDTVKQTILNPIFFLCDSWRMWPCVFIQKHNVSPIDWCYFLGRLSNTSCCCWEYKSVLNVWFRF